jgi:hypothetical protein
MMMMRSLNKMVKTLTNEDYGSRLTENVNEAIYILPDGRMLDGCFDYGAREHDHRIIEGAYKDKDRYTDGFWDSVHKDYRLVRMVPESQTALIKGKQRLTLEQKQLISLSGYEIEKY